MENVNPDLELARSFIENTFIGLRYRHSESMHKTLLDYLESAPCKALIEAFLSADVLDAYGRVYEPDFEAFRWEVLRQAKRARASGLVVPDGKKRASGGGRKPAKRVEQDQQMELFEE